MTEIATLLWWFGLSHSFVTKALLVAEFPYFLYSIVEIIEAKETKDSWRDDSHKHLGHLLIKFVEKHHRLQLTKLLYAYSKAALITTWVEKVECKLNK